MELVSVVFSFRNEEENIAELIARTIAALDKSNVRRELIFVNDCSDDRSGEILDHYAKQELDHQNHQHGAALRRIAVRPRRLRSFQR